MAETISRNKRGSLKSMPRVDLTPMVDLGFLLITFFIVSTSMTHPTQMTCNLPANGESSKSAESKTLTLVLANQNKIFYYHGSDSLNTKTIDYSPKDLRNLIIQKQISVKNKFGNKDETVILIKPTKEANYKNVVDALDEMTINEVKRFMLLNANNFEEKMK